MQIRDPRPINRNNSWNNPQIYLKSQNSGGGAGNKRLELTGKWKFPSGRANEEMDII